MTPPPREKPPGMPEEMQAGTGTALEEFRLDALRQALSAELANAEALLPGLLRAARTDARRLFRRSEKAAAEAVRQDGPGAKGLPELLEKTASRLAGFRQGNAPTLADLVALLERLEKATAKLEKRAADRRR